MGKSIKNVTLEDLEEMGIDIKAILQDKLKKKKKRRKNKKSLKKMEDKSFFPKPYQPFNNSYGVGGGFMGPPMLTAKIDPNVSINAVKESENRLSAKITDVTDRFDNLSDRYEKDRNVLVDNVIKNNDLITKQHKKFLKNSMYGSKYNIDIIDLQQPINFSEYGEIENGNRFEGINERFEQSYGGNNNFIKVQSSNFYRDEIPEPDYFNSDDPVGGVNEKEVQFESNYDDEAMKQEDLNNDYQQYQDENNEQTIDESENDNVLDTSVIDEEMLNREKNVKRVREYANGKGSKVLTSEQQTILNEMVSSNMLTEKQLSRINKYKTDVYVEDVEDDEVLIKQPKKVKKSTAKKLQDEVMKNKESDNFKPKKLNK
jgi:hypothetical protein